MNQARLEREEEDEEEDEEEEEANQAFLERKGEKRLKYALRIGILNLQWSARMDKSSSFPKLNENESTRSIICSKYKVNAFTDQLFSSSASVYFPLPRLEKNCQSPCLDDICVFV